MTDEPDNFELPEGMELVSDGTLTPEHDFDADPIVYGTMVNVKVVMIKRGKKLEENRLMTVRTDEGKTAVWESATLKELFDCAKPGGQVYIKFKGLQDLEDGRNPMKVFVTGYLPPAED